MTSRTRHSIRPAGIMARFAPDFHPTEPAYTMPSLNSLKTLLIAVLLALPMLVLADADPAAALQSVQHVTSVEGIDEYRLDNGLKVLLMPDASRPTTTVNITYFVGSKHESYGETGMAHLLEHMLFYGTPSHKDIKAEISERGGHANGTTWYDRTNYFQTLPSGEENLEWALRMEADRMVNSLIDAHDLESEMTVVRNEFEIGETRPIGVLMERVMATAHLWHGYGRSTIGARADIENVPVERLHSFYRRYYQPDNAILILSGNFQPEDALKLVVRHFGKIPAPERSGDMVLWPTYTREPTQDGERNIVVRRKGTFQAILSAWHIPAAGHPDFPALEVLAHLLGNAPSGRLHQALVRNELASAVGTFSMPLGEPSVLLAFAQVDKDGQLELARKMLLNTIGELADSPPDETEVRRAINALKRNIELGLNDSNRVGIDLSEWAAAGDWRLLFLNRDRLEEVTVEDVVRVADTYLRRDNRTLGLFIPEDTPERATIPEAPDTTSLLANYQGRQDRSTGEAFDPSTENIEQHVERFTLSNGARVALLPKKTRGSSVVGSLVMRLGTLETLTGLDAIPGTTGSMLMRGSVNHDRQAITDRISELNSALSIGGGSIVTVDLESVGDQLIPLLELTADILRNPAFDSSELEELRRQLLISIDQGRDDPVSVAWRRVARHNNQYAPEHPDYTTSWDEQVARIRAVQRDQLEEFHRLFYGFGPGSTLTLVGDFDAVELRQALERLFGDFTPEVDFQRYAQPYHSNRPASLVEQMDDKANAGLIGVLELPIGDSHPDYPALKLASHLLGGGFLSSRLANRIRNVEGLSYGVGASFNAHGIDERGSFMFYAMFAPENQQRLIHVLFEELNLAVSQGFEEAELEAGKRGYLQQLELQRSDDESLNNLLNRQLYLGRDLFHQATYEQAVEALTASEVNTVLRRHFDPERLTYATAGDFKAN